MLDLLSDIYMYLFRTGEFKDRFQIQGGIYRETTHYNLSFSFLAQT